MTADRPADQSRSDGTPSRVLSASNPLLRPLVTRTRDLVSGPVQQSEQHVMQRVDESEARLAAHLDRLGAQLADSLSGTRAAAHEQHLLYVSVRTLLEEQAEQISALRAELAALRGATGATEPSR
jgi:hypothetical protein